MTDSDRAECKLIRYDGAGADCEVRLGGYELPLVSLPAAVLRAHGLTAGDAFVCVLSGDAVGTGDIFPTQSDPAEPRLSADELAEIERLHAESVASGG